jgi:hypothetical protein
VAGVSWEIPRTRVGNRIVVVAWAVFALAAVGTGVLIYQAVAGSDGGVSGPLPTTVGTVSTGTSTPSTPGTATSSATESPTLKPPLLPAAAAKPTREGAAAFLRYFFDVYNYSYATLSSTQLREVSSPKCQYCAAAIESVEDGRAEGLRYEDGVVTIKVAVAAPGNARDGLLVNALLTQTAGVVYDRDGLARESSLALPAQRVDVIVMWTEGRWIMRGVDVIKATP